MKFWDPILLFTISSKYQVLIWEFLNSITCKMPTTFLFFSPSKMSFSVQWGCSEKSHHLLSYWLKPVSLHLLITVSWIRYGNYPILKTGKWGLAMLTNLCGPRSWAVSHRSDARTKKSELPSWTTLWPSQLCFFLGSALFAFWVPFWKAMS